MATWRELSLDSLRAARVPQSFSKFWESLMNKKQVAQLVDEQLQLHHPGGVTIEVVRDAVRRQDDYWHVPVRPSAQPPRIYEYYETLAEVEATLEENEQLQVFLVPTIPEDPGLTAPSPGFMPAHSG